MLCTVCTHECVNMCVRGERDIEMQGNTVEKKPALPLSACNFIIWVYSTEIIVGVSFFFHIPPCDFAFKWPKTWLTHWGLCSLGLFHVYQIWEKSVHSLKGRTKALQWKQTSTETHMKPSYSHTLHIFFTRFSWPKKVHYGKYMTLINDNF